MSAGRELDRPIVLRRPRQSCLPGLITGGDDADRIEHRIVLLDLELSVAVRRPAEYRFARIQLSANNRFASLLVDDATAQRSGYLESQRGVSGPSLSPAVGFRKRLP